MSLNYDQDEEGFIRPFIPSKFNSSQCKWTFKHTIIGLILLFPYVSIPILFGLVANIKKTTNNYNQATTVVSFPVSSGLSSWFSEILSKKSNHFIRPSNSNTAIQFSPVVLSLNVDGEVQLGAGTSVYKNQSTYHSSCPNYVDLDAVFSNSYILSYYDKINQVAILSVVQVDVSKDVHIMSSTPSDYDFYQLTVLNPDQGIFVFISQDSNSTSETAFIVAGQVDSTTYAITIGEPTQYTSLYSIDPLITRLSSYSFAITYYDYTVYPAKVMTKYGVLSQSNLSVSLSSAIPIVSDEYYSVYNSIIGLSKSDYFVLHYNSSATPSESNLQVVQVNIVNGESTPSNAVITVSEPSVLSNSRPAYYLSSARINNYTAVVIFAESYANYGLRAVVISFDPSVSNSIFFSSSLQVTSGQTFTALSDDIIPDIDVSTIYSTYEKSISGIGTGSASISLLFSDLSNGGALETAIIQLTSSGTLVRTSPNYILNGGNPSFETIYSWGALATAIGAPYFSQSLIVSSLTPLDCSSMANFEFSVMETLPSAVGITETSVSSFDVQSTSISTILSGTVSGFTNLIVGKPYYATTKGSLVAGSDYYGRYPGATFSTTSYVDTSDGSGSTGIITSLDSFVGVAISPTTLLLNI